MPDHSRLLEGALWLWKVFVRPDQIVRNNVQLNRRVRATNRVHAQVILVCRSHRPGLEFLVRLEIVPCLTTIDVLHSPSRVISLEVWRVLVIDRAIRSAIGRAIGGLDVASPPDAHGNFS